MADESVLCRHQKRGVCFVISAPSGAGKTTIAAALRKKNKSLFTSISVTTRAPRPHEKEGVDYYFRTLDQFHQMVANDELIESAEVFGNGYGTPRAPLVKALEEGRDIILDIDWQGYRRVRSALKDDVVGLFILPPSLEVLSERLNNRATDSSDVIKKRMDSALEEISHWKEFDYVIVNDDLSKAISDAQTILSSAHFETKRSEQ